MAMPRASRTHAASLIARGPGAITDVTVTMYKYVPVVFGAIITLGGDVLRDTAELCASPNTLAATSLWASRASPAAWR